MHSFDKKILEECRHLDLGNILGFGHYKSKQLEHSILNSNQNNQEAIHTLEELVAALSEGERTTYSEIVHSLQIPVSTFEEYCSWSSESYTRNCIVDTEEFELILLCWEPGQITPIHDHGGEECWVRVIEGDLRETIYQEEEDKLKEITSSVAKTNDVTYMIDFMGYHSLENLSSERSMSLHLYAKPIRSCNLFDEAEGKFVNTEMTYHTEAEFGSKV